MGLIKRRNTPTGPVFNMTGVTVTPSGVGIGEPATSDEMIPVGADLSDDERHELEGRYGAQIVNAGRSQVAPIFFNAGKLVSYASPFAPFIGLVDGTTGLYNQHQRGDFQRLGDIVSGDNGWWDKTKSAAPIVGETALNTALALPGATDAILYGVGRFGTGSLKQGARNYLVAKNFKMDINPGQLPYAGSGKYTFEGSPYLLRQRVSPGKQKSYYGVSFPQTSSYSSLYDAADQVSGLNPGEAVQFKMSPDQADIVDNLLSDNYAIYKNGDHTIFVKEADFTKQFLNYLDNYLSPGTQWYQNMLNNGYSRSQVDAIADVVRLRAKNANNYDWNKMFDTVKDQLETEGQMNHSFYRNNNIDINAFMTPRDKIEKAVHEFLGHSIDWDAFNPKNDIFTQSLVRTRKDVVDPIIEEIMQSPKLQEFYKGLSEKGEKFYTKYIFKNDPLLGYDEFRARLLEHLNGQNSEEVLTGLLNRGIITKDQWKRLMSRMAVAAPFIAVKEKGED